MLRRRGNDEDLRLQLTGINPQPAHSAIAASRLNESRGQQPTLQTSGAELSTISTSASPDATASAAC